MIPLQVPGATELVIIAMNLLVVLAILAGVVYVLRRVKPRRDVHERLDRIERKLGELEAAVHDRGNDERK